MFLLSTIILGVTAIVSTTAFTWGLFRAIRPKSKDYVWVDYFTLLSSWDQFISDHSFSFVAASATCSVICVTTLWKIKCSQDISLPNSALPENLIKVGDNTELVALTEINKEINALADSIKEISALTDNMKELSALTSNIKELSTLISNMKELSTLIDYKKDLDALTKTEQSLNKLTTLSNNVLRDIDSVYNLVKDPTLITSSDSVASYVVKYPNPSCINIRPNEPVVYKIKGLFDPSLSDSTTHVLLTTKDAVAHLNSGITKFLINTNLTNAQSASAPVAKIADLGANLNSQQIYAVYLNQHDLLLKFSKSLVSMQRERDSWAHLLKSQTQMFNVILNNDHYGRACFEHLFSSLTEAQKHQFYTKLVENKTTQPGLLLYAQYEPVFKAFSDALSATVGGGQ